MRARMNEHILFRPGVATLFQPESYFWHDQVKEIYHLLKMLNILLINSNCSVRGDQFFFGERI